MGVCPGIVPHALDHDDDGDGDDDVGGGARFLDLSFF